MFFQVKLIKSRIKFNKNIKISMVHMRVVQNARLEVLEVTHVRKKKINKFSYIFQNFSYSLFSLVLIHYQYYFSLY